MLPIDEKKEYNITSLHHEKLLNYGEESFSNFDNLQDRIPDIYEPNFNIKKPRNKMKHLTPKKKKRK